MIHIKHVDRAAPPFPVPSAIAYEPEALALFARFTTPPTIARRGIVNSLIKALKDGGVWPLLDALYVMAAADSQAARRNWIADVYNLTATNSPTFTADRDFSFDGASNYLNTGFNPTTAPSAKFTLNSAHMGAWHRTGTNNAGDPSYDIGNNNSQITRNGSTTSTFIRPNISGYTSANAGHAVNKVWVRSASNAWEFYRSGAVSVTGTSATTSLSNASFLIGAVSGSSFGVNKVSVAHFGSKLTAGQVAAMHVALNTYMQAVGAA